MARVAESRGFASRRSEVSTTAAAKLLGVSRPHVCKLFDAGFLEGRMVGSRRRICRDSLERYRREQERGHAVLDELADLTAELGLH